MTNITRYKKYKNKLMTGDAMYLFLLNKLPV